MLIISHCLSRGWFIYPRRYLLRLSANTICTFYALRRDKPSPSNINNPGSTGVRTALLLNTLRFLSSRVEILGGKPAVSSSWIPADGSAFSPASAARRMAAEDPRCVFGSLAARTPNCAPLYPDIHLSALALAARWCLSLFPGSTLYLHRHALTA